MALNLFAVFTVLLLLLPPLVWWRWGLAAALIVTVVELVLAAVVFYLMAIYHLFPQIEREKPFQNPEERSAYQQSVSGLLVYVFLFVPAAAALSGGVLALAMAISRSIWRTVLVRRPTSPPNGG